MSDIKAMYRTVMADHFPPEMTITFGDQKLVYRKRTWKLPDSKGEVIEMGLKTPARRRPSISWWAAT
jgi:phosphoribosylaminoimidazolecarboxamide formyltransferase/IMP cyclohydrolase